jgi:hypothetical protein
MIISATIIQNLRESCEIDWYLQAELAYNKRFGISINITKNSDKVLDKKYHKKSKPEIRFFAIPFFN